MNPLGVDGAPGEQAFPPAEYDARLARVRAEMNRARLDFLLLHSLPDICYLCGFQTPLSDWYHCLIVPRHGDPILQVCDPELAATHTYLRSIIPVSWERMDEAAEQLAAILHEQGAAAATIGVEGRRPGLNPHTSDHLRRRLPGARFEDATELVLDVRTIKSPAEIACLREAARYSLLGMEAAIAVIKPGVTENQISAAAMQAMTAAGSEYFNIDPIVRAGRRSGITHATAKRTSIGRGEPIFMEFGGVHQRYCAPLLRTAVIGEPSERTRKLAATSLRAVDLVLETMRPGRTLAEVAGTAAAALRDLDLSVQMRGYFGYSVGIGFPPSWVERSMEIAEGRHTMLQPGMTFHVHRSMRVPGVVGVGFSETVLVTESGCEPLTSLPRQLIVV